MGTAQESGGAEFLVPFATRIAHQLRDRGTDPRSVLETIESELAGIEIETHLAGLSQILLADLLQQEIAEAGRSLSVPVQRTDTLKLPAPDCPFDAVIGNPLYGVHSHCARTGCETSRGPCRRYD